jgi:ribose 5-phosphate isomerase B
VRVAIASDHAGYVLKEDLKRFLKGLGVDVDDLGTSTEAQVDYPDYAALVADAIIAGRADRGVLVCGTGIGMSIAANKIPGIRAALLTDEQSAELSRAHNDANVMAVGGRTTPPAIAHAIVRRFLATPFSGGRHQQRVDKITGLETHPAPTRTDPS